MRTLKRSTRLSGEERREAILKAARKIFSERGFHGATTRGLAQEADVSEALIFKHFPTKEALYDAMLASCKKSPGGEEGQRLLALKPSTSTLVLLIHHLFTKHHPGSDEVKVLVRLLTRSLGEDGEFARIILKHFDATWIEKITECIEASRRAGDIKSGAVKPQMAAWFAHHLLMALMLIDFSQHNSVEYGANKSQVVSAAVVFILRGLGMSEDAIREHYDPAALELLSAR